MSQFAFLYQAPQATRVDYYSITNNIKLKGDSRLWQHAGQMFHIILTHFPLHRNEIGLGDMKVHTGSGFLITVHTNVALIFNISDCTGTLIIILQKQGQDCTIGNQDLQDFSKCYIFPLFVIILPLHSLIICMEIRVRKLFQMKFQVESMEIPFFEFRLSVCVVFVVLDVDYADCNKKTLTLT